MKRVRQRTRRNSGRADPVSDVGRIEAHEATDLDVRNPALRDETPHMPLGDAKPLCHRTDVQQVRKLFHTLHNRVDSHERDKPVPVQSNSHTLHHDARHTRETAVKIGTDGRSLYATGRCPHAPITSPWIVPAPRLCPPRALTIGHGWSRAVSSGQPTCALTCTNVCTVKVGQRSARPSKLAMPVDPGHPRFRSEHVSAGQGERDGDGSVTATRLRTRMFRHAGRRRGCQWRS
jgi:hypothetical protein